MSHADEYADFGCKKVVTARSSHQCDACREAILPGHRYVNHRHASDGKWGQTKLCMRCRAVVDALWEKTRKPVDLELSCDETWEDAFGEPPPPDVAALAFALPKDYLVEDKGDPTLVVRRTRRLGRWELVRFLPVYPYEKPVFQWFPTQRSAEVARLILSGVDVDLVQAFQWLDDLVYSWRHRPTEAGGLALACMMLFFKRAEVPEIPRWWQRLLDKQIEDLDKMTYVDTEEIA